MGNVIEQTDQFHHLLCVLADHGALTPQGWQINQEGLANAAGFKGKRALYVYMRKAREHGLITVEEYRGFNPGERTPNRYRLTLTPDEWLERRDEVVDRVRAVIREKVSVKNRIAAMERKRLQKLGARAEAKAAGRPLPAAPGPVPVDAEAIAARVARMGPDPDLRGW